MSAHRYWRLRFVNNNGGGVGSAATAITELQLCTAGGTNRCGSGTPSASSFFSGLPASNAFDGNTSTWWATNGGDANAYLAYDFGAGNTWDIQQVVVQCRNDGFYTTQSPTAFYVQYSDDGSTWTTYWYVGVGQVAAWTTGSTQTFIYYTVAGAQQLKSEQPAMELTTPTGNGARDPALMRSAGTATTVSGTVTAAGVAQAGLIVRAYDKASGAMVGQATTNGSGNYSINCGGFTDVYVAAFDPTSYQALIFDEVIPG